ncbi:MAG TPA: nucleotidyl transferase AbiEii/AbiGii toxin family protein [Kiritimatiellia bacterium]|nr:nucleotidyl transferase AbiEii/AbiGii toxin family protein [Kiritimatiellia bacterium]
MARTGALRALYQRRKGRDLFDLWLGLTEGHARPAVVVETFKAYMKHEGRTVSRADFSANIEAKREHPLFSADLNNLLPVGSDFDFKSAFHVFEKKILPLL